MLDIRTDYFLPMVLRRLSTGTSDEQKEAIEILLLYRQVYSVPLNIRRGIIRHLTPLLKSPLASLRYWTACALGEYECVEAVVPLQDALMIEKDLFVSGWMQGAVSHLLKTNIHDAFDKLQSKEPATRAQGAQTLFFDTSLGARELVAQSLHETDLYVLSWLLLSIPGRAQRLQRAALTFEPDQKWVLRSFSENLVHRRIIPLDFLISLLYSGHESTVEFALWNLSLARDERALPIVRRMVDPVFQPSTQVREWVYKYLGFVPSKDSLPILQAALNVEVAPKVREAIAFSLGRIGGSLAFELLIEMLHDEDDVVRRRSARAIGNITDLWETGERILVSLLETESSPLVIQEVYSVLQVKGAPLILSNIPILESHSMNSLLQRQVVELLVALADKKNLPVKEQLLDLAGRVPVEPKQILKLTRVLSGDYELLRTLYFLRVLAMTFLAYIEAGLRDCFTH